jgi:polysaccharide pyruvyl transferase WcaK-like protein
MITIISTEAENYVALTLQEKSDVNLAYNYSLTATNLQTNTAITVVLTDISTNPSRYNLFILDGTDFTDGEYHYSATQIGGEVVEIGKLLVYSPKTEIFFEP